ncbi:TetR/AcrR family transcriptional regulator [Streptomyces sp. A1277]|uniref:TetR/AcrR family transcriptional regulator n=1 Tax=Streptomyces sp. A1277 TaxID=2563103 RepID=UPI0010A23684|nr:TetR/AcrR family transcriptional regulator [Streptomyces sp. A1277]THA36625.1 TetR/AcrR family transcriptional regulator [Streptomyces sp. A1277]
MARQERAEQTRRKLVEAAAEEFAAHGYSGASLSGIVRSAGVTMGALTFHFPSKSLLADAVQEAGEDATRAVLDAGPVTPGLPAPIGDILALAGAIEANPSMRAAARFARDGHSPAAGWYGSWVPEVRARLGRYEASGLAPLLTFVLLGVEAATVAPETLRAVTGSDPRDDLARALETLSDLMASVQSVPE